MTDVKAKINYKVLILLSMAGFVIVIDSTAMNVSISYLVEDLNTNIGVIQKIMSMYTFTMAALMLPGAKLADIFGAKKIFMIGVCTYGIGTLIAALAVNTTMLMIGWALIEGMAAALMMPTALSLISSTYSGRQRSIAMAVFTAVGSVGVAVGPIVGGTITTYLSWRVVFGMEVIIILAILANYKTLTKINSQEGDRSIRFDLSGMLISVAALLLIIVGGLRAKSDFMTAMFIMVAGFILIFILLRFLKWKKAKGRAILLDTDIFSQKNYDLVLLINLSLQICMSGMMFIISIYLQNILQYDALKTGMTLMPLSLMILIAAMLVTKLTDKIPSNIIVGIGGLTIFIGATLLYFATHGTNLVSGMMMLPSMIAIGLGIGCSMSLTGNIGLGALDTKFSNQGAGAMTTINNLGSSLGTAVIGSLFLSMIKPQIILQLIEKFPSEFGGQSVESVAIFLEGAFQKVKVMDPTFSTFSEETLAGIRESVIRGVNNSLGLVLLAIMGLSLFASAIAFFALKIRKESI